MVHEREKKILGKSIKGRNSDGTVFRGLIKFENAVSGTVDSQHRPSKTLSSILSQHPSSNRSSSPQSSLSYSSATPLLPEQNSVAPKLEEWSLQVSSRLVSTPLAPPDGTGENISRPAGHTYASPTLHLSKGLTSTELRNINASAVSFHPDQTERELRFKPKGEPRLSKHMICYAALECNVVNHTLANTSAFSTGARDFCSNGRAAFGSVGPRSVSDILPLRKTVSNNMAGNYSRLLSSRLLSSLTIRVLRPERKRNRVSRRPAISRLRRPTLEVRISVLLSLTQL